MRRGGWLFLRSRRFPLILGLTGMTLLLTGSASGMLRDSLVTADWATVPLLSAAAFPGVAWAIIGVSPGRALERALPGARLAVYRLMLFGLTSAACMLAVIAAVAPRSVMETEPIAVYRNVLFGLGAGAVSAVLLPRHISWAPLLSYAALNWTIGTSTSWGTARAWALLNADAGSLPAAGGTAAMFVAGAAVYARFDGKGNR